MCLVTCMDQLLQKGLFYYESLGQSLSPRATKVGERTAAVESDVQERVLDPYGGHD